jgi:hypothetical protein
MKLLRCEGPKKLPEPTPIGASGESVTPVAHHVTDSAVVQLSMLGRLTQELLYCDT